MSLKRAVAVAASALLLGGLAAAPAGAAGTSTSATTATTAACSLWAGSVTAGGDQASTTITATSPITAEKATAWPKMFAPGVAKIASTWTETMGISGNTQTYGEIILNSTLYSGEYGHDDSTGKPFSTVKSQGGGYNGYRAIESSFYGGRTVRGAWYRLRGDGVLYRTENKVVSRWSGYASVKTMALISETATYDTFLATTFGGQLYTIHIPVAAGKAPIVTKVRTSTWQGFEFLVAEKCGTQGTLLLAVDKDTKSAYLYAVSHAKGTATVIKGLGKVPGSFSDPVYFLNTAEGNPPLFGE
ncbi:hypothetical protein AB0E69_30025 [Kribbella sp. NPDC026611]|uniref:hypothetical protein n=1 Tax=Kribbella sp. NPDC026611 TaxID=3154911 RepID=UPI00340A2663